MNPVVCTYANCQGEQLARLLIRHPALHGHEFHWPGANLGQSPPDDAVERCTLFIRQSTYPEPPFAANLPAQARRIVVPTLSCSLFWPYAFDRPDEPAGWRFPYGDRFLMRKVKEGFGAEQAADAYLALDVPAAVRIERLLALEEQRWRNEDSRTDVPMADFTIAHLLGERLFFTPDHPTDRLLHELANRVLLRIGLAPFAEPDWATHTHALAATEVPVHPAIVGHLALPFLRHDQQYALFGGHLELDARETYIRYARALKAPSFEDGMREAVAALHADNLGSALNLCELVRWRQPGNRDAAATLAVVHALQGQREQAAALLMSTLT